MNKRKSQSKNKAFSLVELSIVVVVIGILITGLIKASNLYDNFKIQAARTLTKSSPVLGIKDLVAWFETSSEESFSNATTGRLLTNINDGTAISRWNDINPQRTYKNNATQTTNTNYRPLYKEKVLNGIPAIRFDGTNDSFDLPSGEILNTPITIFVVKRNNGNQSDKYIIARRSTSDSLGPNGIVALNSNVSYCASSSVSWNSLNYTSTLKNEILSFSCSSTTTKIRLNKSSWNSRNTATTMINQPTMPAAIGRNAGFAVGSNAFNGDIFEIIIYNRALNEEEVTSVEQYLSKKYRITLN